MDLNLDLHGLGQAVADAVREEVASFGQTATDAIAALTDAQLRALLYDGVLRVQPLPDPPAVGASLAELAAFESALAQRSAVFAHIAALEEQYGQRAAALRAAAFMAAQRLLARIGGLGLTALLAAL